MTHVKLEFDELCSTSLSTSTQENRIKILCENAQESAANVAVETHQRADKAEKEQQDSTPPAIFPKILGYYFY